MRVFITGISGLLGINAAHAWAAEHEVSGCFHNHPIDLTGVRAYATDLTEPQAIDHLLEDTRPELVMHTAGLTNVDACEEQPALARQLNVEVASCVARATSAVGAKLVHVSTDHLFDGIGAWRREDETPTPLNVYAATKAEAERSVLQHCPDALIIRTNFYGWGSPIRRSFSDWILEGLRARQELRMFEDVFFTPMLINDLVDTIFDLLQRGATGIYHIAGAERLSKIEFAQVLAEVFQIDRPRLVPTHLAAVGLPARRPRDMSLATERAVHLLGRTMPGVRAGLTRLRALGEEGWPATVAAAVRAVGVADAR